ncbi:MAG TPA: UDP-N-acetylmuramate--L-alanine ligase [Dehalococcoidia bacterium]
MTSPAIPQRVHLVGIGGMHMSAIARILLAWGHEVSGSDQRATLLTDTIEALGAKVTIGHDAANVGDAGLVVTTSAATSDNPELDEARHRGIPVIKRADMVARLMEGKRAVCVAGSHGKSTTSGLVAFILERARRDPTYLIGAEVADLGTNAAPGSGPEVVVEADEYDRAFLSYKPSIACVLNLEPDHLDYYKTMDALREAFEGYVANTVRGGTVVLCADSPGAIALRDHVPAGVAVETYSLRHDMRLPSRASPRAGWYGRIKPVDAAGGPKAPSQTFEVIRYGDSFGEFRTALAGVHNVSNALAAIVICATLGLSAGEIAGPLAAYHGVGRRFETIGEVGGVTVMDDYAHHPTEIEVIAAAARQRFPGRRIVVLFQPHTFARTRYLLDGFRTCFRGFDHLFLLETYAAREAIADGMTAEQLSHEVEAPEPGYFADFEAAAEGVAAELRPGDVFFTVGAGDVNAVGPMVLERLRARTPKTPRQVVGG